MSAVEEAYPEAVVEVWAEDEHRVGLLPLERRGWAAAGERPVTVARERYEWTYVWGFVEPITGRVWWLVLPTVDTAVCSLALAEFAAAMGLGPDKRIVLQWDGAGWHSSRGLVGADRLLQLKYAVARLSANRTSLSDSHPSIASLQRGEGQKHPYRRNSHSAGTGCSRMPGPSTTTSI